MGVGTAMTEDLAWLVALLSPRDIAIHPNYASRETVTGPACLALLTSSQFAALTRLQESEQWRALLDVDPQGCLAIGAVREAFSVGSVETGAEQLRGISIDLIADRPALAVVCAVISSACYAEVDRDELARQVLQVAIERIQTRKGGSALILSGVLLANLSLRQLDQGHATSAETARLASATLNDVKVDTLPRFPLSLGVEWDSATSLSNIINLLANGCVHHEASFSSDIQPRLDLIRKPSPVLVQRLRGRVATGFQKHVENELSDLLQSRGVSWSDEGPDGDAELCEALFMAEFSGHPVARNYRHLLGMHRFLRGTATGQEWLVRESLRLIRQSGDKKKLVAVLNAVRNRGPLVALQGEAMQIGTRRTTGPLLRDVELQVLSAGAYLLGRKAASEQMRVLLNTADYRVAATPRSAQLSSVRLSALWRAVIPLSVAAGEPSRAARALFDEVRNAWPDEALDYEYSIIIGQLGRDAWSDPGLQRTVERWASSDAASAGHPQARKAFRRALDLAAPHLEPGLGHEEALDLETVQRLIDRSLVHPTIEFPQARVEAAESLILGVMAQTREAAARGQYSLGGIAECELGVALALMADRRALWSSICEYLCDPRVQRADKSSAIDRMIRAFRDIPPIVAELLEGRSAQLLDGGPEMSLRSAPAPFPEGLRLCAVLGLLGSTEVLDQTGRLLGERSPGIRRAGAEVLLDLLAASFDYPWLSTSAMLLSHDRDTEVRATAGRALTQLKDYGEVGVDAATSRMISLLDEDGYLIPNSILVGLLDNPTALNGRLRTKVQAVAATHIDASARRHADELISKT